MPNNRHIQVLDKKVTELSDALAHLGRGTDLKELLRLIRKPGWTTPAEFAFSVAMIDSLQVQVRGIEHMCSQLVAAAKQVGVEGRLGADAGLDVDAGFAATRGQAGEQEVRRTN